MSFGNEAHLRHTSGDVLRLHSGDARLETAPQDGGTLVSWSISGRELLRRRPPGQRDPLQSACFPLVPFSNVVRDGGFHFQRRFHPMTPNHPLEAEPIHGDAWLAPWTIDDLSGHRVSMSYRHAATSGFPFRYRVIQELALGRRSLTVVLTLTNADRCPMPAGLGLHPYFRRAPRMQLKAPHGGRWNDVEPLSERRFCKAEEFGEETLDVCYANWRGLFHLYWPDDGLHITARASESARTLVVYAPKTSDFVCIEPVTHVNDGFNAAARGVACTGVRTLSPGATMNLKVKFSAEYRDAAGKTAQRPRTSAWTRGDSD